LCKDFWAVGGYPVVHVVDTVCNDPDFLLCLAHIRSAEQNDSVVEYDAVGRNRIHFDTGLLCVCLDAADEVLAFGLPLVKAFVALVAPVHDTRLTRREDLANEGTLALLTIREKDSGGNATVDVKPDVASLLVGPTVDSAAARCLLQDLFVTEADILAGSPK
jgi:hypothetical protein